MKAADKVNTAGAAKPPEPDAQHAARFRHQPHLARITEVLLGGKENYQSDRDVAEVVRAVAPEIPQLLRAQRAFVAWAVRTSAVDRGIDQFIDLGCGLPTHRSTHEVAQGVTPTARVVYVVLDPVVVVHCQALLAAPPGTVTVVQADCATAENSAPRTGLSPGSPRPNGRKPLCRERSDEGSS